MLGFLFVDEDVVHARTDEHSTRPAARSCARPTTRCRGLGELDHGRDRGGAARGAGRGAGAQAAQRLRPGAGRGHRAAGSALRCSSRWSCSAASARSPACSGADMTLPGSTVAPGPGRLGRSALPPDPARPAAPAGGGRSSASLLMLPRLRPVRRRWSRRSSSWPSTWSTGQGAVDVARLADLDEPDAGRAGVPQPRARHVDPADLADHPVRARHRRRAGWPRSGRASAGGSCSPASASRWSRCSRRWSSARSLPGAGRDDVSGHANDFTSTTRDYLLVILLPHAAPGGGGGVRLPRLPHPGLRRALPPCVGGGRCVPAFLFGLAHGLGQSIPVFFDRFAFGLVAGRPRGAHRRARGRHRDARAQQLAGLRPGARLRRHGLHPEPLRRQLVEHPGDPHPVAGLPRSGRARVPPDGAGDHDQRGTFWRRRRAACKVSGGRSTTLASSRAKRRERPSTIGIWCNWQHDWFWSS